MMPASRAEPSEQIAQGSRQACDRFRSASYQSCRIPLLPANGKIFDSQRRQKDRTCRFQGTNRKHRGESRPLLWRNRNQDPTQASRQSIEGQILPDEIEGLRLFCHNLSLCRIGEEEEIRLVADDHEVVKQAS